MFAALARQRFAQLCRAYGVLSLSAALFILPAEGTMTGGGRMGEWMTSLPGLSAIVERSYSPEEVATFLVVSAGLAVGTWIVGVFWIPLGRSAHLPNASAKLAFGLAVVGATGFFLFLAAVPPTDPDSSTDRIRLLYGLAKSMPTVAIGLNSILLLLPLACALLAAEGMAVIFGPRR